MQHLGNTKRDKPATSPSLTADKASCEDVLSLPAFLSTHTFPVPSFWWAPVTTVSILTAFSQLPPPHSEGQEEFIGGNTWSSRGWPPHCSRLIRVECTSFSQRTPITTTAPAAQCGRTSDRLSPASSALSSHQALSVPSLNYILFTNTRPDFRWSLNKG